MSRGPYAAFSRVVDDMSILAMTLFVEKQRGFSKTRPGPPPTQAELLAEALAAPPRIAWPRDLDRSGRRVRVRAELPSMDRETYFDLFPATGGRADTLIVYHHGLGEIPHDVLVRPMRLSKTLRSRCDVVAIKGLFHEHARAPSDLIVCRERFIRSMVASASLASAIVDARGACYQHRVMCGVSMGGVISLIEASHEPSFDLYVPFVAGPDLADVLLHSSFSRLVQGSWLRRARRAEWRDRLDLTQHLQQAEGPPIRPLLARSDQLFRHPKQADAYARVPRARVVSCHGGHLTAAVRPALLVRHLLRNVREVCWSAPVGDPHPEPALAATGA